MPSLRTPTASRRQPRGPAGARSPLSASVGREEGDTDDDEDEERVEGDISRDDEGSSS